MPSKLDRELENQTKWLLRFAFLDLNTLRPGELLDLQWDVFHKFPHASQAGSFVQPQTQEVSVDWRGQATGRFPFPVASPRLLRRLQSELRDGLKRLKKRNSWKIPAIAFLLRFRGESLVRLYTGSIRETFLATAAEYLVRAWPRIRACTKCDKLFVPVRRQTYCSQSCSQSVRYQRYVQRHGRVRNYRKEHKARQEKAAERRYGKRPKLNVGREEK